MLLEARRGLPDTSTELAPPHGTMTELPSSRLSRRGSPSLVDVSTTTRGRAICGPQAVADLVIEDALAAGTPPTAIHNERFSW